MTEKKTLSINGREVEFSDERNLLEVIRKAGFYVPTLCYNSELSNHGDCRLCLVEIIGKNGRPNTIVPSCSTDPQPGMEVQTENARLRSMRKITIELLLANHDMDCPTCARNENCQLQSIARYLNVTKVRFRKPEKLAPIDTSSPSIQFDPNRCVLCGACVRACSELQGVNAVHFVNRDGSACITPTFGKGLGEVECVNCGQCAAVCPTGSLIPKQDSDRLWAALYDDTKTVVVQVAPAVRVAVGETFGAKPGENYAGKLVAALKTMGFKHVYDTCFAADMTIFEEATEFIDRFTKKERLPLFTSCCPAWVKYCETFYPNFIPNLSTTRSPQAIFGALAKEILPERLGCKREDLVVVSIMPCTAKKYEAKLEKLSHEGIPDVDIVVTTDEIQRLIRSLGIKLGELEPLPFDHPLGEASGGGYIFGASGGVMEAALRYAVEKVSGTKLEKVEFEAVRGFESLKEATIPTPAGEVRVAAAHGLVNVKKLLDRVRSGRAQYDFVEVMACPGGCISGGGQPHGVTDDIRRKRIEGIYAIDREASFSKPQDNVSVQERYQEALGGAPGSHRAHELLHTSFEDRSDLLY